VQRAHVLAPLRFALLAMVGGPIIAALVVLLVLVMPGVVETIAYFAGRPDGAVFVLPATGALFGLTSLDGIVVALAPAIASVALVLGIEKLKPLSLIEVVALTALATGSVGLLIAPEDIASFGWLMALPAMPAAAIVWLAARHFGWVGDPA
jgi:hypothetical protein